MNISIQKRTRTTTEDSWTDWLIVTESAPFTDSDLQQYKIEETTTFDITDVTRNITVDSTSEKNILIKGDGVFDTLMETISKHVSSQYDTGRITGTDYTTLYLGTIQSTLSESIRFVLQSKAAEKNLDMIKTQIKLYSRQIAGFDDNKYQKVLEILLNAWSITFQDTDTTYIPPILKNITGNDEDDAILKAMNRALQNNIT